MHAILTELCDHVIECRVFDDGQVYGDPFGASCNVVPVGETALLSMLLIGRADWSLFSVYRAIRKACRAAGFKAGDFDRKSGARTGPHRVGERGEQ